MSYCNSLKSFIKNLVSF